MFGLRMGGMGRVGSGLTLTQAAANIRAAYRTSPQVWYDPSDFVWNWRRNLLTYSEQFDNAAWLKVAGGVGVTPVVTPNVETAPDGTLTADRIDIDRSTSTAGNLSYVQSANATAAATQYTGSLYVKAATSGDVGKQIQFRHFSAGPVLTVTLTTDWQRVVREETGIAGTRSMQFGFVATGGPTGAVSFFAWGAQVELGSTATTYQRITDGVQDYFTYGSALPTLYQDSAGTTPVTAVEQPVGLMLDKSRGLVLGSELVTNGDFSSGTTGWSVATGWSIASGVATATATGGASLAVTPNPGIVSGRTYRATLTILSSTVAGSGIGVNVGGTLVGTFTTPGTYSALIVAGATGVVAINARGAGTWEGTIDNISVRELPGLHATQATALSRPVLSARKNMLANTETLATQNVTVRAGLHVLSFWGTGTVTLSGVSTSGPLVGTGVNDRVSLAFTPTAGTLTLTVTGSVLRAQLEETRE